MEEAEYDEACEKLAESYRLDPGTGTLLNVADCREKQGRLATAWALFTEAEVAAKRDGRDDRVAFARERIDALVPRLSKLTIEVPDGALVEGLVVKLDGTEVREAAWGVPAPIDGGVHVIEASAPGRLPFHGEVEVEKEGDQKRVTLQVLDKAKAAPTPEPPPPSVAPAPPHTPPVTQDWPTHRPLGVPVYIVGGATVALGAIALGTGLTAVKKKDDFDSANTNPDESVETRETLRDEAQEVQLVNALFTGAFAGGVAITTVLILTRPEKPMKRRNLGATPWLSPSGAGVVVRGRL